MSRLLADEFSDDLRDDVADFACGNEPWAILASDWIKSNTGALASMARGTRVFLYYTIDGQLVGFGAIGETSWPNFAPDKTPVIPMLAVSSDFQKQGYCTEIVEDLVDRAYEIGGSAVVLTVDPENPAIEIYRKLHFSELPDRSPRGHIKMARTLAVE
jgi:ribosomal protein S18 acetylase RimI-like enzyme